MNQASLSAGVVRRIITPQKGIYQIGYGDRTKGNIGFHDDLTATALVLNDGTTRVAIVALDILTINEFIVDRIRARLTPTEVLVCCSHTHSGPIAYADEKSPRQNREYIDSLVNNTVDAVNEVKEGLTIALESAQGLFVKALPNAKFYLFEHNRDVYTSLVESAYPNVIEIFNCDIINAKSIRNLRFKQAFFDFCCGFDACLERLKTLKNIVNDLEVFAITVSVRDGKKITEEREYAVEINNTLLKEFPSFDIISCRVYKDTSTMVGAILKNKNGWLVKIYLLILFLIGMFQRM